MSKTPSVTSVDLEKTIMSKVRANEIVMKPRWYFVMGSLLMMAGLISLSISAIFLINLTFFLLKRHGPMGQWRLELILHSFPTWIPILAIIGLGLGIWLLKKYDFAYKKNFWLIAVGFIFSVVMGAFMLDLLGLNDIWSHRGPMRRFYQPLENQDTPFPRGPRQGSGQGQNGPSHRFFQ